MYAPPTSAPTRSMPRWLPILSALLLPCMFLLIMGGLTVLAPQTTMLATVFAALVVAGVLRQLTPSMRWAGVALVTFWFVISGAVGGVVILMANTAGVPSLSGALGGLATMFALQAARIWWQFQRAKRQAIIA